MELIQQRVVKLLVWFLKIHCRYECLNLKSGFNKHKTQQYNIDNRSLCERKSRRQINVDMLGKTGIANK